MPCDTRLREGQTLTQRAAQVESALTRLKRYLTTGSVRIQIGPTGAVSFTNWNDRDDLSDVCAFRSLQAAGSWELRQAVARAEVAQGRKVNPRAVAAGEHSHDGGKTWHGGH